MMLSSGIEIQGEGKGDWGRFSFVNHMGWDEIEMGYEIDTSIFYICTCRNLLSSLFPFCGFPWFSSLGMIVLSVSLTGNDIAGLATHRSDHFQ